MVEESTGSLLCAEEDGDEDDDGVGAGETEADVEGEMTSDVPEEAAGSEGVGVWEAVTVSVAGSWVCTLVCTTVSVWTLV